MKLDDTYLMQEVSAPASAAEKIQIGAFQPRSLVAGPGERAVVWVAGCLRRCPSCMKPDLFDFAAGELVSVDELAERILGIPNLHGVTFSGGEPFEQAIPLSALAKRLHEHGLTIAVYSGYTLAALQSQRERFGPLLQQVDILIDGEYRHDSPGPLMWRGSQNQKIYEFVSGEPRQRKEPQIVQEMQLAWEDGALRITGFPSTTIIQQLSRSLAARGIELHEMERRES